MNELLLVKKPAAPAEPEIPRLRVLVIEDNPDAAGAMSELLEGWGYHAAAVCEGSQGVARALAWRPGVVLLDINLPDVDGYTVARRLRAEPALTGVFIAAITGHGMREDEERSRQAGFDHHFSKPINLRELRRLMECRAKNAG